MGLKLVISTDSHRIDNLRYVRFGIGQARRGWLEQKDVLNTMPLKEIMKFFKRN